MVASTTLLACGGRQASAGDNDRPGTGSGEPAQPCAATDLCLDTRSIRPSTKPLGGILVVFWSQISDDGPDPRPKIAYSTAFDGDETRVAIPLRSLASPDDANLLCERSCSDEALCPCTSKERVGIAYVAVVADTNGDGTADLDYDLNAEPLIGSARVVVVTSDEAIDPSTAGLGTLFPEGIRAGLHPYALERSTAGSMDRLRPAAAGAVFELLVCDTHDAKACAPALPNLQ